jgi:hypothetical protein
MERPFAKEEIEVYVIRPDCLLSGNRAGFKSFELP